MHTYISIPPEFVHRFSRPSVPIPSGESSKRGGFFLIIHPISHPKPPRTDPPYAHRYLMTDEDDPHWAIAVGPETVRGGKKPNDAEDDPHPIIEFLLQITKPLTSAVLGAALGAEIVDRPPGDGILETIQKPLVIFLVAGFVLLVLAAVEYFYT